MPLIIFKKKRITEIIEEMLGYDPYWENVVLLMHMDGVDNGTTFIDETGKVVTPHSSAKVRTTQRKFGSASAYFDGNAYLSVPASNDFDFQAGDMTFECWIYPTSLPISSLASDIVTTNGPSNGCGIRMWATNDVGFIWSINGVSSEVRSKGPLSLNTWYHVAGVRSGSNTYLFVNGTLENVVSCGPGVQNNPGSGVSIGRNATNAGWYFTGYLDEVRITKGIARYTENFAVPSRAFPNTPAPVPDPYWNSVKLALHLNGEDNSTVFTDEKGKVVTTVGNAKITTAQSKFGGSSGYFDGTGDYLRVPSHPDFDFGSDDFTIDCFFRTNKTNAYQTIVSRGSGGNTGTCFWLFVGNSGEVGGYLASVWSSWNFGGMSAPNLVQAGQWYHLAMVRSNGTMRIYLDGVQVFSYPVGTMSVVTSSDPVLVGSYVTDAYWFDGNLNDVRITKGVARYTNTFTVPTGPFSPPL